MEIVVAGSKVLLSDFIDKVAKVDKILWSL